MSRATGIEVGRAACVIVAAGRRGRHAVEVSALDVFGPGTWPADDDAITLLLQETRLAKRLPRRAGVVVWGLPEDAALDQPGIPRAVRAIEAAGFVVDRVLTPSQALAALSGMPPRGGTGAAVAWMALNTSGAAIAIVRDAQLLFSRSFDWTFRQDLAEPREQLLQRYSLLSQLAPELQRAIAAVQETWGVRVESALTCGDLPELRSLTMPLIEELDLDIETLDSTEGLRATGSARGEAFAEGASALRLATAAALARRGAPGRITASRHLLRAGAAAVSVAGAGWLAYGLFSPPDGPVPAAQESHSPAAPGRPDHAVAPVPSAPEPVPPVRAATPAPPSAGAVRPDTGAAVVPPLPQGPKAPPSQPAVRSRLQLPSVEQRQMPDVEALRPVSPVGSPAGVGPPALTPLDVPLPRIDSILIDSRRTRAIIEGRIVSVGDAVGPRQVVRIEAEAVILREPSGLEVRVLLRENRESAGSTPSLSGGRLTGARQASTRRQEPVIVPADVRDWEALFLPPPS